MSFYDLTEQEKKLLSLIREAESRGTPNDYTAVLTRNDPDLTTRTIDEVIATDANDNFTYPVLGAYSLTPQLVSALKQNLEIPGNTQFNKQTQDYLALQVIKGLDYDTWAASALAGGDTTFQERLAEVFPHVPTTSGTTLYETESKFTSTNFLNRLSGIRSGGIGETTEISVNPRAPEPANPGSGSGTIPPAGGPIPANITGVLPTSAAQRDASNPYLYVPLQFGNNRYDFRTGKKVNLYPVVQPVGPPSTFPPSAVPPSGGAGTTEPDPPVSSVARAEAENPIPTREKSSPEPTSEEPRFTLADIRTPTPEEREAMIRERNLKTPRELREEQSFRDFLSRSIR